MKIGIQFAMPPEFHAMPGAREIEPFETASGVPFYRLAPDVIACAGGNIAPLHGGRGVLNEKR